MFTHCIQRLLVSTLVLPLALFASSLWAQAPGRGATADFEVEYLQFIIDHHYSALRMSEIAAGTAEIREPDITHQEGVAPTPGSEALDGKAQLEVLRSLARKVNRRQREEIITAQIYLRDWYGVEHAPQVPTEHEAAIQALETAPAGAEFDQLFMETLSHHHYQALTPSLNCVVGRDVLHLQLYRFCDGIVQQQVREIEDMRELLATEYGIDDFQAFTDANDSDDATDGANGPADTDEADDVPAPNNSVEQGGEEQTDEVLDETF